MRNQKPKQNKRSLSSYVNNRQDSIGFSLIELSISLLIIGIIAAAVVASHRLITSSKLQGLTKEIRQIDEAVQTFYITYKAFPGDYDDAANVWGLINGDGDGECEELNLTTGVNERLGFWAQLSASGIYPISGTIGEAIQTNYDSLVNKRAIFIETNYGGFKVSLVNTLQIGRGVNTDDAAFLPKDQYYIDSKIDDGKPLTGDLTYRVNNNVSDASCTNSSSSYYYTSTAFGCNIIYVIDPN